MKSPRQFSFPKKAFTLLEMTIVIMVLLALIGVGTFSAKNVGDWKLGREAGETLRSIYSAQRMYLADNPTTQVSTLTEKVLIPYIPNVPPATTATTFQQLQDLGLLAPLESIDGATLTFLVNQSPPKVAVSGIAYDPSGSTTDSLWDVGK